MEKKSHPIFVKLQNPVFQGLMMISVVLLFNLGAKIISMAGMEIEQRFPWTIAASFLLFFSAMNAVLSIFSKNIDNYWSRSVFSFVGVAAFSALMAYFFSKLTMNEAGSYKWIFIVLTIGYLVFLLMLTAMRKIVDFAQREEWNHPKIRQKRRS